MIPNRDRSKLGNIVLHELLGRIGQLTNAFIAPLVVPFDDLDPGRSSASPLNPCRDLFVGGSRSNEILEVLSRYFHKSEKQVIKRTIKVIFTGGARQDCSAPFHRPGGS